MKRCPKCFRANADDADACVLCKESLAGAEISLLYDPAKDAEEWAKNHVTRSKIMRRDTIIAALFYGVVIDFMVAIMGFVFDPLTLLVFFVSALAVAVAVSTGMAGQFIAAALQGGTGVALMVLFHFPLQPFVFFLILGLLLAPVLFCHWLDGMRDMYR